MPKSRKHGIVTKREAVMAAAVDLLLLNGYDGTSMDAVAAQAGVSKTTVYAHFADKPTLFRAVMEHAASLLSPRIREAASAAEHLTAEERLAVVLGEIVKAATVPELIAFFRVLIAEQERRGLLSGLLDETRVDTGAPSVGEILAPFIEAIAAERGVELVDPEQWVIVLLRLCAPALQFDMLISDFRPTEDLLRMHVRLVVGIFVNGAFPRGGKKAELPAGYDAYPWGPAFNR